MTRKTTDWTTAWIRIELEGADSAHYHSIMRTECRRKSFPDGVDRLITLPRRYWNAYDTIGEAWNLTNERESLVFGKVSESAAPGDGGFEALIREHYEVCIWRGWLVYNKHERGQTNDNSPKSLGHR